MKTQTPVSQQTVNIPVRFTAKNKKSDDVIMVLNTNVIDQSSGKLKVLYVIDESQPMMIMDLSVFNEDYDVLIKDKIQQ
ncbi:hypothetical protein YerA41_140 [Yersinia phage YerA41]|jgi:hypothetical protein|uniref:Uncharacterized protein n=1 Tax=Yersinia phage vB_Yru_GN1 TaxID=3074381 RepID=A0AA86IYG9_9CAUD|nr:hypothetical protein YerA41_140 [Yersinia phage YerA41]BES79949.1 hypothetical protein [Yersinia phage vB_Yru_GN1]